jgi:hypothetical protein
MGGWMNEIDDDDDDETDVCMRGDWMHGVQMHPRPEWHSSAHNTELDRFKGLWIEPRGTAVPECKHMWRMRTMNQQPLLASKSVVGNALPPFVAAKGQCVAVAGAVGASLADKLEVPTPHKHAH